jgi:hypothetical protein
MKDDKAKTLARWIAEGDQGWAIAVDFFAGLSDQDCDAIMRLGVAVEMADFDYVREQFNASDNILRVACFLMHLAINEISVRGMSQALEDKK